ncbi:hypothetical protein HKX48_006097 [Thoreauomyces humboldtii]|nr:hypothetical protein HKX48_006097 [Thoreauomyces humboldtii]
MLVGAHHAFAADSATQDWPPGLSSAHIDEQLPPGPHRKPKRTNHNELERKRRQVQRQKLQDLRDVIPRLGKTNKASTVVIIGRAKEHIDLLNLRVETLEATLDRQKSSSSTGGGDPTGCASQDAAHAEDRLVERLQMENAELRRQIADLWSRNSGREVSTPESSSTVDRSGVAMPDSHVDDTVSRRSAEASGALQYVEPECRVAGAVLHNAAGASRSVDLGMCAAPQPEICAAPENGPGARQLLFRDASGLPALSILLSANSAPGDPALGSFPDPHTPSLGNFFVPANQGDRTPDERFELVKAETGSWHSTLSSPMEEIDEPIIRSDRISSGDTILFDGRMSNQRPDPSLPHAQYYLGERVWTAVPPGLGDSAVELDPLRQIRCEECGKGFAGKVMLDCSSCQSWYHTSCIDGGDLSATPPPCPSCGESLRP